MWTSDKVWANPSEILASARDRFDIVEGLVPDCGVTWLYGASMSYKTFAAMSIAVAASSGREWVGRVVEKCFVVYVGAEGGLSLHVRRAGAEMAAGEAGDLRVVSERPLLDTRGGQSYLRGVLQGLAGNLFGEWEPEDVAERAEYWRGVEAYQSEVEGCEDCAMLVVVDTYSQTSCGDDKGNVGAYIKGLRDMIDDARRETDIRLSFVVVDHATKAGGSYMGSVSKLNDVDSQLEMVRDGASSRATLHHRKVKDGVESQPVALDLVPQVVGDFVDAYGRPITTLVVEDGARAAKIADMAEGKAGVILTLLEDEGSRCEEETLRRLFFAHRSNEGIKEESVARAFRRGRENLLEARLIAVDGDCLVVTP